MYNDKKKALISLNIKALLLNESILSLITPSSASFTGQ
jgi:hypothetical protein